MVDSDLVKKIAKNVIAGEMGVGGSIEVSVAFVSPQKIRALNSQWRKIDCVTDVLSFGQDNFLRSFSKKTLQPNEFLGEIVVCPAQVAKDAEEFKKTFNQELSWVVVHGMLHLFGYGHERGGKEAALMKKRESEYLNPNI